MDCERWLFLVALQTQSRGHRNFRLRSRPDPAPEIFARLPRTRRLPKALRMEAWHNGIHLSCVAQFRLRHGAVTREAETCQFLPIDSLRQSGSHWKTLSRSRRSLSTE